MKETIPVNPVVKYQEQEQKRRETAKKNFNFEQDLQDYLEDTFPLDDDIAREINREYASAVKNKDSAGLEDLIDNLKSKIRYITPKYKENEEERQYVLKLKLLQEALEEMVKN